MEIQKEPPMGSSLSASYSACLQTWLPTVQEVLQAD